MEVVSALSVWLHDLATVVLIGHYLLLVLVYQPVLKTEFRAREVGDFLSKVLQRVQPWLGLALLIFVVTGILLMFANPQYEGVGQFHNRWSVLMLAKHVVVIAMVGLAFWITRLAQPAQAARVAAYNPHPPLLYRVDALIPLQAGLGVLVLLMTALARI